MSISSQYKMRDKTPSQVMRIADFDFGSWSTSRQPNSQTTQTKYKMAPPSSQPKRIAELYAEMMPPPSINNTASKRASRSHFQIQKSYMSTSKKKLHEKKADHTVVRRALDFLGNQAVDVQVHPKSKPITQKFVFTCKPKVEIEKPITKTGSRLTMHQARVSNITKIGSNISQSILVQNDNASSLAGSQHRYDLRSYRSTGMDWHKSLNNDLPTNCTKYRNINESFDASIWEENSPKIGGLQNSMLDYTRSTQKEPDNVSDSLCDMLLKTDISSPNLSVQVCLIQSKIRENSQNITAHLDFLNIISKEIENNKNKLTLCLETNNEILEMTCNLIKSVKSSAKKHSSIPRSVFTDNLYKRSPSVTKSSTKSKLRQDIAKLKGELTDVVENKTLEESPDAYSENKTLEKLSDAYSEYKENIGVAPTNLSYSSKPSNDDLRKTLLTSMFKNYKGAVPHSPTNNSGKQLTHQPPSLTVKTFKSPLQACKPSSPKNKRLSAKSKETTPKREHSPKVGMSPGSVNLFKMESPKITKSSQMYKSLKDSVVFLKTPVGKKSFGPDLAFQTPNTRSRNITSNNIKKQLESLYDS